MGNKLKIWIDLCHTPHVPFFIPLMNEFEKLGHTVDITARTGFQTCELIEKAGLKYFKIGKHYGKNKLAKLIGLVWRSLQLYFFARNKKFDIAVSHGSPYQVLAAFFLKIPSITLDDYENSNFVIFNKFASRIFMPAVINDDILKERGIDVNKVVKYPGLKEFVYIQDFRPDKSIISELNLDMNEIIVTVRPPATEAHYHNIEGEKLFSEVIRYLLYEPNVKLIILPRSIEQKNKMKNIFDKYNERIIIPEKAIDGKNLLWHSDIVISGGGTINREAATLSVPVYSIFKGQKGAVDRHLEKEGKLRFINSISDIKNIKVLKWTRKNSNITDLGHTKSFITQNIIEYAWNSEKSKELFH